MLAVSAPVSTNYLLSRNLLIVHGATALQLAGIQEELHDTNLDVVSAAEDNTLPPSAIALVAGDSAAHALSVIESRFAIVLDADPSCERAVEAMRHGAWDYLPWPAAPGRLRQIVKRALRQLDADADAQLTRVALNRHPGFESVLGNSSALLAALDTASRVASSSCPVLLAGEAGTGKETVARAMHRAAGRGPDSFVVLHDHSAVLELLEQEEGVTVFVPEVGSLSLTAQAALLSIIDSRRARVLAATAVNPLQLADKGLFRRDLFYRLSAVQINLPPLRERVSDLPELDEYFLDRMAGARAMEPPALSAGLMERLRAWHWPGNLDELNAVLERLLALAGDNHEISARDLPESMHPVQSVLGAIRLELPALGVSLEAVERELLSQALRRSKGNQTHAARFLGLTRKTLIYRMEKFGLREPAQGEAGI